MFSYEQRRKAIETLIRFDHSYADTIRELGYPSRAMLRNWWKDYEEFGEVRPDKRTREPKYTDEMRRAAVDYYLEHGRSLARTMRAMGYPRSREYLSKWIDELAPGRRKVRRAGQANRDIPVEVKIEAVAALEARGGTAGEVADAYGVSRAAPYVWRRQLLSGDNAPDGSYARGGNVRDSLDDLPDDVEELKRMATDLKRQLRALQLEIDVRRATAEILKKDQGADPNRLTNREKAAVVNRLRGEWRLKDLLSALGMAKSSYEYAARALEREPTEAELAAEAAVVEAFEEAGGAYGYRRVLRAVNAKPGVRIGEHRVRRVMRERHLAGAMPRCVSSTSRFTKQHPFVSHVSVKILHARASPWHQSFLLLQLPAHERVFDPVRLPVVGDEPAVVDDAVHHRLGHVVVGKDLTPSGEFDVGGENERDPLVAHRHHPEQEPCPVGIGGKVPPLVQDDEVAPVEPPERVLCRPLLIRTPQLAYQLRRRPERDFSALTAGEQPQRYRGMGLSIA